MCDVSELSREGAERDSIAAIQQRVEVSGAAVERQLDGLSEPVDVLVGQATEIDQRWRREELRCILGMQRCIVDSVALLLLPHL